MTNKEREACKEAWYDDPETDRIRPDFNIYRRGWFAALYWKPKQAPTIKLLKSCKAAMLYAYEDHCDQYYLNMVKDIDAFIKGESE